MNNKPNNAPPLVACHRCDLLMREPAPDSAAPAVEICCPRCGARVYRPTRASLDQALALVLTACIVFVIANAFPIASIDAQGHRNETTLLGAVQLLWQQDMKLIAALVCATTVIVPALELLVFGFALLLLRIGRPLQTRRRLHLALRMVLQTRPWSMVEVFMLGVLVSLVKLAHLASLTAGVALWAYATLMVMLVILSTTVDIRKLWSGLPIRRTTSMPEPADIRAGHGGEEPSAASLNLASCHVCGLLSPIPAGRNRLNCPRCTTPLHLRRPNSLAATWALLLAAFILFLPANLLPIMETGSMFGFQRDTIISGVLFLWHSGSWPLALLVFVASIVVPLFKLLALALLLVSVQFNWTRHRHARTGLYQGLESIGRWSMLDIYVVTMLSALVQIQSLATISAGPGALAFGGVVVLTMLATLHFDPRLMWDANVSKDVVNHG